MVVTIVVFFSFSEQLIILLCERKAGSYGFHPGFLAHKGSLSSIIQTGQINIKNTLTTSCYHCIFNTLNLPDILASSLSSKLSFLILVLQYLYGQTKIALLIWRDFTNTTGNILRVVGLHFMGAPPRVGEEDELQSASSEVGDLQLVWFFWQRSCCRLQLS